MLILFWNILILPLLDTIIQKNPSRTPSNDAKTLIKGDELL